LEDTLQGALKAQNSLSFGESSENFPTFKTIEHVIFSFTPSPADHACTPMQSALRI